MTGVSFIVTCYNKAPYIPAVINAIFAQEGDFEREVFIIDDGSTDDSPAILDRMCAGRTGVHVIHQKIRVRSPPQTRGHERRRNRG